MPDTPPPSTGRRTSRISAEGGAAAGTGRRPPRLLGAPATMRARGRGGSLLAGSEVDLCLKDPRLPGRRRRNRRRADAHPGLDGRRPHGRGAPCRLDPARRAAVPRLRLPDLAPAEQLRPRRAGRHHGRRPVNPVGLHLADHPPSGNRPPRWSTRRGRRPVRLGDSASNPGFGRLNTYGIRPIQKVVGSV